MLLTPEIVAAVVAGVVGVSVAVVLVRRRRSAPGIGAAHGEPESRTPTGTLRTSLTATRQGLLSRLQGAWGAGKDSAARLTDLEEILLSADVGVKTTQALLDRLRPRVRELTDAEALRRALRDDMRAVVADGSALRSEGEEGGPKPYVIVVAGVNGVGKTTTIGKLAHRYRQSGKTVLLVAADTFRAAASEQLELWAERVGAMCVRHQSGADPSAVAFDGLKAAIAREIDVAIIDTAGRLHVKTNLMEELKKVVRTIGRQLDGAPHEVLLVVDAATGQNAINQARVFCDVLPVTGIVLTKLDGTAKGGAVLAVRAELGVPIRYVGLGEKPEDLQPFDPDAFVDALLATDVS
jgi:fused signal recognition particle receptor